MEKVSAFIVSSLGKKMAFLPILAATYIHFQGKHTGPEINDQPIDTLFSHYDFIIVGGGSAGKNNIYYTDLIKLLYITRFVHQYYFYYDIVLIISSKLNGYLQYEIKTQQQLLRCGAGK